MSGNANTTGNKKSPKHAALIPGTNFVVDQRFRAFAVQDGLVVTGQQQFSGAAAAELVIEALGR